MNSRRWAFSIAFALAGCNLGPSEMKLGQVPRTNTEGALTLPLNVSRAFTPTGYFYNVWPPADTTFTVVDPEKWNNFLAYQSIYLHPACADRVSLDTLAKYDTTLNGITSPAGFYKEFDCSEFTYAPSSEDDLYGGVFWLRGNNFGDHPGVKVKGGARKVVFWARSLDSAQVVMFGVGVANFSNLKPWFYFTPYADEWGAPVSKKTARFGRRTIIDAATGIQKDTAVVLDSVPEGAYSSEYKTITSKWSLYSLDLIQLYGFFQHPDGSPYDSLPDHNLIGAFYWAMEHKQILDSSLVSNPFKVSDGSMRRVRYGSATILIDGIRYE